VTQVDRLAKNKLLYLVTERFTKIDLHPDKVDNAQMGLAFEDLIRRFAELSNETAGEHFTPREVIRLMVDLIFIEDSEALTRLPNYSLIAVHRKSVFICQKSLR
jgi:type I restriction enzyme M protein